MCSAGIFVVGRALLVAATLLTGCALIPNAEHEGNLASLRGGADADTGVDADSGAGADAGTDTDTDSDHVDGDSDGHTPADGDCDDSDPNISPTATDTVGDGIDQNCDGVDGTDGDGDGFALTEGGGDDCDDGDATVNPSATETWYDGVDQDCDGASDDDADGDGYDSDAQGGDDCDDADAAISPDAVEVCLDGMDNDCDGVVDTCTLSLSATGAKLVGEATGDLAGISVSGAGDMDGDGKADLLIGARMHDSGGSTVGAAYLVLGPVSGTLDLGAADAKLVGEVGYDEFADAGSSVSGAGDVDGDGKVDLIVGAQRAASGGRNAGAAYLLRGPVTGTLELGAADAKLVGEAAEDFAGYSVSGAGDVDGDGKDDLLVGARGEDSGGVLAGAAYLVLGPVSGTLDLSAADAKLVGETGGDFAGRSVSGAGDVDGDGNDDLLIGAYLHVSGGSTVGAAYLVLGPSSGTLDLGVADAKLIGEADGDRAGCSVSGAGDVDGDGKADFIVGASAEGSGGASPGAAYLVLGPVSGTLDLGAADAKLLGESGGDLAGWSVSGAGDVDGDGKDDLLVGARGEDAGGGLAGAAYLVLGPVSGTLDLGASDAKLLGESGGDHAGVSVSGAGDVDGDGKADLLVGAYGEDSRGTDAGAAYLVFGGDL